MDIKCPECGEVDDLFFHGTCDSPRDCDHVSHLATCNKCKVLTEFWQDESECQHMLIIGATKHYCDNNDDHEGPHHSPSGVEWHE